MVHQNQASVNYITGENPKNTQKWASVGIFKPAEPQSPRTACFYYRLSQRI